MPKYKCHKEVWALQIKEIKAELDGYYIYPVERGYEPIKVDHDYMTKHQPQVGGYYVVYEGGYKSFSPADAFGRLHADHQEHGGMIMAERTHRITHKLKTWPEFYGITVSGKKKFEIRRNDRDFKVGDELLLQEYVPTHCHTNETFGYTGKEALFRVDHIMTAEDAAFIGRGYDGPPMQEGYVIMSTSLIP